MTAPVELHPDELRPDAQWDVIRGDEFLGVVMDEGTWTTQNRGRFAAWSSRGPAPRGVVGFFDSKEEARDAIAELWPTEAAVTSENANDDEGLAVNGRPERRTLKGLAAPFRVFGVEGVHGGIWPRGGRGGPEGLPFTVVRTEVVAGCRYGYTADGRTVHFIGVASKVWVIPGGSA